MTEPAGIAVGATLLVGVLAFAVVRPRRLPEMVAAIPAAGIALALGLVTPARAGETLAGFGPTVAFLAAILVIAGLAETEGVFSWLGGVMARRAGSPLRLFRAVFVVAAATTVVLSLDATVVLLTPAVIAATRSARARPDPALYVTAHLSNTASLLLPVSNLTNLLAFEATGLTFWRFGAVMALPLAACLAVEYLSFRLVFAGDLRPTTCAAAAGGAEDVPGRGSLRHTESGDRPHRARPPVRVLAILGAVLVGFAVAPVAGIQPALIAVAGAAALAIPALAGRRIGVRMLAKAVNLPFLAFIAAQLIVVDGAVGHGPAAWLAARLPVGTTLAAVLALAAVAAVLACVINNLPATLVLLAALGAHPAPGTVLAVLIGVNIGPNLTYTGSLAVLLWRRVLQRHQLSPSIRRFTVLGLVTVPPCLVVAAVTLWLGLQL